MTLNELVVDLTVNIEVKIDDMAITDAVHVLHAVGDWCFKHAEELEADDA